MESEVRSDVWKEKTFLKEEGKATQYDTKEKIWSPIRK